MALEFTPAVTRAMEVAKSIAVSAGAKEVLPIHLLHGLLKEEEGRCFLLLSECGMDIDQFRKSAAFELGEGDADMPISFACNQVIRTARTIWRESTVEEAINSEHVLLALLREPGEQAELLTTLGVNTQDLHSRISSAVQGPPLKLDEPLEIEDSTLLVDCGRILDANANRAREGLRVLEDYCRFVLDDAFMSKELKSLRHGLVSAVEKLLPNSHYLAARETLRDVGTEISTTREQQRYSLEATAKVNLKRLQEALRSLEETAKILNPDVGRELEQLRYHAYTLERMISFGLSSSRGLQEVRLYLLVTGSQCRGSLEWTIKEAVAGGVQMVQLREKELDDRQLWERARQLRQWTRDGGALFVMNDRPDIARLVEADGVHLGQEDLPVREARRILGPDAIVGVSTHDLDQVHQAIKDGAGYIGVGPTFPSKTKDFAEFAGLEFVRQVAKETSLPAFAIGGISLGNLPEVVHAGLSRVAVSQTICGSETPEATARAMRQLLD